MIQVIYSKIRNFFLNGHERTLLAKKNIAISFLLKGVSIAISLILVPITISYVNATQYGIWLTLSSVIGLFSFFDIGLGNGLRNKLAESNALSETNNSRIYISTTYAIISLISLIVFVCFFILNFFLDWNVILNVPQNLDSNLNVLAVIVFGSFCLQLVLQIIYSMLTAFHAISKVSLIACIGQLGTLFCIFLLTKKTEGSLLYLIITLTGLPLLVQFGATIWYFKTKYAKFAPSLKLVNFKYAKNLLSVGGLFFFIQLGSLLLFQTDNIVITQLFGPSEVTVFNLSYKLFSVIVMVFSIIMNPFWSAFTDAYAKKDMDWIKGVFKRMYKYWFVLIGVSFILLAASPYIFKLWIGEHIKIPFALSLTMTLYVIGICWMMIHNFFINGIGKLRVQFYLYVVSVVINIPLSILLGKSFGLVGITFANVIVVVTMGTVLYIQCNKILNNSVDGIWDR